MGVNRNAIGADLVMIDDQSGRDELERRCVKAQAIWPSKARSPTPLESLRIHRPLHQKCARANFPRLFTFQRQGSGHIINIVSTAGLKILPTMGVYAATKNAVRTVSEALRQEAGPHLRITEISPGMIATDFASSMTDPAVMEAMSRRTKNIAIAPESIARGIAYAIEQPDDVDVGSIVIRPTVQD